MQLTVFHHILNYGLSVQFPGAFSRLRATLLSVLDETPTRTSIGDLVKQFHAFATVYLKSMVQHGRIHPHLINLSLSDIAVDCIAPLFERDASGRLPRLQRYYSRLNWRDCSAEELAAQTRRLVCSSVHQGMRRIWRDNDRSLANIIRNTKAGLLKSRTLHLVDEGGEVWVECREGDSHVCNKADSRDLPDMSQEYLDVHISPFVASESTIPHILERLSEFLADETEYRRRVPLVMLAITIRFAATRAGAEEVGGGEPWNSLTHNEIELFVADAVGRVDRDVATSYLDTGKVDKACLSAYLRAVRQLLICRYASNDGEKAILYSLLLESIPGLSKEAYKEDHRNRLEYLYHCAETDFLDSLRKNLA